MSKSRKAGVVDSYALVKAVERTAPARTPAPADPTSPTSERDDDLKTLGAHVAHTALPTTKQIECYECGYKFKLHGRAPTTNCNKCRTILDLTDHIVGQRWEGTIKTCGLVRVLPNGMVVGGTIMANDMILEGVIEAGMVRLTRRLEVRRSGRFSEARVKATDLLIAAGATVTLTKPVDYRDVEIAGTLDATLCATGIVTIRAGGGFAGQLQTKQLVVEEGGGLMADLTVGNPTL